MVTCRLTACTAGSAPGPTLGIEYGKPLPFYYYYYYYHYYRHIAAFCRTTWVSQHQKGKPFWILVEQQMMGWQRHQLDQYANHLQLASDR